MEFHHGLEKEKGRIGLDVFLQGGATVHHPLQQEYIDVSLESVRIVYSMLMTLQRCNPFPAYISLSLSLCE